MTDALMDRIKAHRSAPDVYDPPTFDQMADRIAQTEAKLAKAEAYLQKISRHANRSCSAIAARALAELEGGE